MDFKKYLIKHNILYKVIKYDTKSCIYKLEDFNIVFIENNNNNFTLDYDLFYYIHSHNKNYSFLLNNKSFNKYYYVNFKKNNWIKVDFERSQKEVLNFGKKIFDYEIDSFNSIFKTHY